MKLLLAGCPFEVVPDQALTPADRASLVPLLAPDQGAARGPGFRLELVDEAPWPEADLQSFGDLAPAAVEAVTDSIRVTHRRFVAELQPASRSGRLFRRDAAPAAIALTLRVALCASLPAVAGLPLHAAGILLARRALVFFGASGAGKSTLAALAPGPVFSDELVAVTLGPPTLHATGFWGQAGDGGAVPDAPLAALVELAKGPSFRLERLEPVVALRRLLGSIMVPPLPWLWGATITLAHRATRELPAYRMEWSPARPPWAELRRAILDR